MEDRTVEPFSGFLHPDWNMGFTKLPHELIDELHKIESFTELKIILYIMRHTWGFQEAGIPKKITIDEFMKGRKRRDGTRMDNGTGLSDRGVKDGVAKALAHGYIICDTDNSDRGRITKSYAIKLFQQAN